MQRALYFQLLGHVALAACTADTFEDVTLALKKAGFGPKEISRGLEMLERGEKILASRILDYVDDRNLEHAVHIATNEVEMWLQTVSVRLRKGGLDPDALEDAVGSDIHTHNHTVSAIGQALRTLGVLRTDEEVQSALGESRLHDTMLRGHTLLKKLYKVADDLSAPSSICPKGEPIHQQIDVLMGEMLTWLTNLERTLTSVKDAELIGLVGLLPDGVGLPLGGAGGKITLHANAQQDAPNPSEATLTSGWSVGRQGNRENDGQGWVEASYE